MRGEEDSELVRGAREHMESNHPSIAREITDEELLALSHEEPSPVSR